MNGVPRRASSSSTGRCTCSTAPRPLADRTAAPARTLPCSGLRAGVTVPTRWSRAAASGRACRPSVNANTESSRAFEELDHRTRPARRRRAVPPRPPPACGRRNAFPRRPVRLDHARRARLAAPRQSAPRGVEDVIAALRPLDPGGATMGRMPRPCAASAMPATSGPSGPIGGSIASADQLEQAFPVLCPNRVTGRAPRSRGSGCGVELADSALWLSFRSAPRPEPTITRTRSSRNGSAGYASVVAIGDSASVARRTARREWRSSGCRAARSARRRRGRGARDLIGGRCRRDDADTRYDEACSASASRRPRPACAAAGRPGGGRRRVAAPAFDQEQLRRSYPHPGGVCGKGALEAVAVEAAPVESG